MADANTIRSEPADRSGADAVRVWDILPSLKGRVAAAKTTMHCDDREVAEIVKKASQDARRLHEQARRKADELLNGARADSVRIRSDSASRGYTEGLDKARIEVAKELGAAFSERCSNLQSDVTAIMDAIVAERNAMWNSIESEITSVALDIARKIIKTEVEQNSKVIQTVVVDAIKRVTDRASVRLIVSPDDLTHVRSTREDLLHVIDGIKNLVIDADRRVGRGGCMIETSAGSIDSKIETQIEQVERAMRTK